MADLTLLPGDDQLLFSYQFIRPSNEELRPREYLTPDEVERLLAAAKKMGRYGLRNYTLLLMMYRHGLRVSEAVGLRWSAVDFKDAVLHVRRMKRGKPSVHPIPGVELRALRQLRRKYPEGEQLFVSERRAPLADDGVRALVRRLGKAAGFEWPIHPHMLRHACGYRLANDGHDLRAIQDYLGHRNIAHTVRYTELAPGRFKDFWKD